METQYNNVVLVDEFDTPIGEMEKLKAHETGVLHRAFSVFLFNKNGELLLQQRAREKYHGGGLWTNTCCSHPQANETVEESAKKRLQFEMGIVCELEWVYSFLYQEKVENNLIEHEFDHVFVGQYNRDPQPNPDEVQNFKWMKIADILIDIDQHPSHYTVWFKKALPVLMGKMAQK